MNSIAINKTANANEGNPLPLWVYVLSITLLVTLTVSGSVYLYQRNLQATEFRDQQAGLHVLKQELLASDTVLTINWLRTLNPLVRNVRGGIIWNNETQRGLMHFKNLPVSNKSEQYQLWIYDLTKKPGDRISAATFRTDYTPSGEYLVEIKPQETVVQPYKFELVLEVPVSVDSRRPADKAVLELRGLHESEKSLKGMLYREKPLLLAQP